MGSRHPDRDKIAGTLSERLRAARKARGMTQAQVAEAVKVSTEFYARCERAQAVPSLETFRDLVVVLEISADDLLAGAIIPLVQPSPLAGLPPHLAELTRDILDLEVSSQRFIDRLLHHCNKRYDDS